MSKDFKEERLKSLEQALSNGDDQEPEEVEEPQELEEDEGVQAGNLGSEEESPYLENVDSEEPEADSEEITEDGDVLDKVFKGDVDNLKKSYVESQREITKAQQRIKDLEGQLQSRPNMPDNEKVQKLLELAEKAEDVESLIESQSSKPNGKSNTTSKEDGKFDGIENEFLPDTETLIESGYIKGNLDDLTDFDKRAVILNAQQAYLSDNLGTIMEENYRNARQKVDQEREKQRLIDQLTEENTRRFEDGFEKAVNQFGLNFASEHKDLFDEIKEEAKTFRDRQDQRLIRPTAVQLATQEVLKRKGMTGGVRKVDDTSNDQPEAEEQRQFSTKHSSSSTRRNKKKKLTLEEQMKQRRAQSATNDLSRRETLYRTRKS